MTQDPLRQLSDLVLFKFVSRLTTMVTTSFLGTEQNMSRHAAAGLRTD